MRPADSSPLSMTDASTSEWMSETAQNEDPPDLKLTEETSTAVASQVALPTNPSAALTTLALTTDFTTVGAHACDSCGLLKRVDLHADKNEKQGHQSTGKPKVQSQQAPQAQQLQEQRKEPAVGLSIESNCQDLLSRSNGGPVG